MTKALPHGQGLLTHRNSFMEEVVARDRGQAHVCSIGGMDVAQEVVEGLPVPMPGRVHQSLITSCPELDKTALRVSLPRAVVRLVGRCPNPEIHHGPLLQHPTCLGVSLFPKLSNMSPSIEKRRGKQSIAPSQPFGTYLPLRIM